MGHIVLFTSLTATETSYYTDSYFSYKDMLSCMMLLTTIQYYNTISSGNKWKKYSDSLSKSRNSTIQKYFLIGNSQHKQSF